MDIRVLGCSGGIGGSLRTTSFLLDEDVLLDAGSGVGALTLDEMRKIRHIVLSHSHLDHILAIPLLIDSIFEHIKTPIEIHALPETIQALQQHIFNNTIWPDFTRLPRPESPVLRFRPLQAGELLELGQRRFEMIPVNHVVPTVGYRISTPDGVFAFSGDTTTNDSFWAALNAGPSLDLLIVEAAFPDSELELCRRAKHYCPSLLAEDLVKLQHRPQIWLTHAKPGAEERIYAEVRQLLGEYNIDHLTGSERFTV
ncbi:MAG: 3',5'-cyclic-nucleotide phosphodiesterase [Thiohalomonadaceae bacterium]